MTAPPEDGPAPRYVGVGIGTYREYPALPRAPAEAQQIADLFASRGVHATVAAATTETGLIAELARVLPPRPEGGVGPLVMLWAGHGDRLPDASLRLVAEDTAKRGAPLLTAEYVASVAVRSGATQVLLIFDTCFSGGGTLPAVTGADRWFADQVGPPGKVWLGVLASAMDWEKARDDLFGERLARLLREGPSRADLRLRWSAHNAGIRGDDLIDALQKEWADDAPHRPKAAQFGNPWVLLPNPRHDPAAQPRVVEHLLLAARGGEPEDETWYFTGRHVVVARLVSWIGSQQPGLRVVTGPAGCGKSAVLGLVVCLSNPEQRAALLARRPLEYADPGAGSVHAHVYARGLARHQLARELDTQLSDVGVLPADRRGKRGAGELVDAVAASGNCPVIVIDGLDEAGVEAWPIAVEVLRQLTRHALVLVGTRELAAPEGEDSLLTRLSPDSADVIQLLNEVDDDADVRHYVARRLQAVDAPAMDAGQIAYTILALPSGDQEGRFLLARVITAQLRTDPVDTTIPGWQQQLSSSVEEALDRDVAALPVRISGEKRLPAAGFDLLAALAWAQGAGLPDDIWPLVATAISPDGTGYTRDDAFWALAAAGRYIVEAGEADHAVYRLSHQRLALHLRERIRSRGVEDAELRIATTLVDTYQELLGTSIAPVDHAYLWRYTWRHCADAATVGIAVLRRLVDLDRAAFLPDLARASQYLASRQEEAGKPFEAVGPGEDAVSAYRELAAGNPAYLLRLAGALGGLGIRYGRVGRRADAVPPTEETVTLHRELAADNPARLPDLAAALNNLSYSYREVGRRADAVPLAEEAVALYREQAADNPARLPELAAALGNLSYSYRQVGRRADAVPLAEEAIALRRELAADNPARLPELAAALGNLSSSYREVGRRADAVPLAEEAVALYREQAADNPAHLPDLAGALTSLGNSYAEVGRRADAVPLAEEAVALYREQAADNPAHLPDLAGALTSLGNSYAEVGRPADAVPLAEEAVALYRELAADNPAYLPDLAGALTNLGVNYHEVGRLTEAVPPAEEAVALYREQAAGNTAYLSELAAALDNLGSRHSDVARHAEAVPVVVEAVSLYRELAAGNSAYLPDLAMAVGNLGNRFSHVGRLADAVAMAEEAVALYRELAADNPAYLPDLARVLNNLGVFYIRVGRLADAVGTTEESVALDRELAADNPAYLPSLAGALSNLSNMYGEVDRPADATPLAEEAVALDRELAAENPAFLPDLARVLNNLGRLYDRVGRLADAVPPVEEAAALYREQAADNPVYLPSLAETLVNLGIRYRDVGRHADAAAQYDGAVALYREIAAGDPAHLSSLATTLVKLGKCRLDAGLPWSEDTAWSSALAAMPTSDLKVGLLVEKAKAGTPPQDISDILAALALTPSATGPALFRVHSACRELRSRDHVLFDRLWQERLKTGQPPWLFLDEDTLITTDEWLRTRTHTEARDYHRDHAEILARPETRTAMDELALAGFDPDLVSRYRQLLDAAADQGVDQAYQPIVVTESLSSWLNADIPGKLQLLQENREMLLSDHAAELLGQWSAASPDDGMIAFSVALLSLAREGLDDRVIAALGEQGRLDIVLTDLLASGKPHQLQAVTQFLLYIDLDKPTLANARFYLAIALTLMGHAEDASEWASDAASLDPSSVNRWINVLAGRVTSHPELAPLIQVLASSRQDEPSDASSNQARARP